MTIPSVVDSITHLGDGTQATYSYPFLIQDEDHLQLTKRTDVGVESLLVISTHYTVTGVDVPLGGTAVLTSNLEDGYDLLIERMPPVLQQSEFPNQGSFAPKSHESAFDYGRMLDQILWGILSPDDYAQARVMLLGRTDTTGSGAYRALSNRIADLADPVDVQDAVTKAWVLLNTGVGLTLADVHEDIGASSSPGVATAGSPPVKMNDAGSVWVKYKTSPTTYDYTIIREGL